MLIFLAFYVLFSMYLIAIGVDFLLKKPNSMGRELFDEMFLESVFAGVANAVFVFF